MHDGSANPMSRKKLVLHFLRQASTISEQQRWLNTRLVDDLSTSVAGANSGVLSSAECARLPRVLLTELRERSEQQQRQMAVENPEAPISSAAVISITANGQLSAILAQPIASATLTSLVPFLDAVGSNAPGPATSITLRDVSLLYRCGQIST